MPVTFHAWHVKHVKIREPSHVLGCTLLRGIGYSWECRCGEKGSIFGSYRKARIDAMAHAADLHDPGVPCDPAALAEIVQLAKDAAGVTD